MIPVLFDSEQINQTLSKGKLIDVLSCEVYEELNGDYSLEFTYPITGEHYKDLLNGGTIEVISPTYQWGLHYVWFDIYKHSLPIDGVVTFYASHISRRLRNNYYTPTQLDPSLLNAVSFFNYCVPAYTATAEKPYFQFYNSDPITDNPVDVAPKSWLATLIGDEGSLVSEYGVDMAFRCMLNPAGSPTQYFPVCYVSHLTHRGADNGVEIRYGYNMTDINHTIDKSGLFNAVVPFWDDGNGNRTFVTGYVVQPTTPITPVKVAVLDCTDYYETQPTEAQLITTAQNYLDQNQPWTISETLTVDFINGVEIDPNAAQIELGDTVHVYWNDAEVSASLRVISYKYDVLAERYSELTLGTPQTQFVAVTGESYAGSVGGGGGGGGLPPGGLTGEALIKNSNADGDAVWSTIRDLLWTNPNIGTAFAPQLVLIANNYQFLLIEFSVAGSPTAVVAVIGVQGATSVAQYATAYSNRLREFSRDFTVNSYGVQFDNAYATTEGSNTAINNALLVPYKIWGLRI